MELVELHRKEHLASVTTRDEFDELRAMKSIDAFFDFAIDRPKTAKDLLRKLVSDTTVGYPESYRVFYLMGMIAGATSFLSEVEASYRLTALKVAADELLDLRTELFLGANRIHARLPAGFKP